MEGVRQGEIQNVRGMRDVRGIDKTEKTIFD